MNRIKLHKYENYQYNCTLNGNENAIGIVIIDEVDRTLSLDKDTVKRALFYMYKRHPLLRSKLRLSDDDYLPYLEIPYDRDHYSTVDSMPFESTKLNTAAQMVRELEQFDSKVFDYENDCMLMWRFKMIEYEEANMQRKLAFALVLPCFLTDGINICVLCIEIVNLINSLLADTVCKEMLSEFNTVVDNVYELIENSGLLDKNKLDMIQENKQHSAGINFRFPKEFRNWHESGLKINILPLCRNASVRIVNYAKVKKIKLTGFFLAAIFYCLKKLYDENGLALPGHLVSYVPVSMRIHLNCTIDFSQMRYLVAQTLVECPLSEQNEFNDIWKDAQILNSKLSEEIRTDNSSLFKLTHSFDWLNSELSNHENKNDSLGSEISLSNIGLNLKQTLVSPNGFLKIAEIYHGDSLLVTDFSDCSFVMHAWSLLTLAFLNHNLTIRGFDLFYCFFQAHGMTVLCFNCPQIDEHLALIMRIDS